MGTTGGVQSGGGVQIPPASVNKDDSQNEVDGLKKLSPHSRLKKVPPPVAPKPQRSLKDRATAAHTNVQTQVSTAKPKVPPKPPERSSSLPPSEQKVITSQLSVEEQAALAKSKGGPKQALLPPQHVAQAKTSQPQVRQEESIAAHKKGLPPTPPEQRNAAQKSVPQQAAIQSPPKPTRPAPPPPPRPELATQNNTNKTHTTTSQPATNATVPLEPTGSTTFKIANPQLEKEYTKLLELDVEIKTLKDQLRGVYNHTKNRELKNKIHTALKSIDARASKKVSSHIDAIRNNNNLSTKKQEAIKEDTARLTAQLPETQQLVTTLVNSAKAKAADPATINQNLEGFINKFESQLEERIESLQTASSIQSKKPATSKRNESLRAMSNVINNMKQLQGLLQELNEDYQNGGEDNADIMGNITELTRAVNKFAQGNAATKKHMLPIKELLSAL